MPMLLFLRLRANFLDCGGGGIGDQEFYGLFFNRSRA